MGLDITAYPTAVLLPAHEWSEDCYDGHARPFCYDGHQRSARNLLLTDYHTDNGGYWTGPCYEVDHAKAFPFAAGSYGGYNAFREALCVAALDLKPQAVWENPDRYVDAPFYELIHFADNEGTIGGEAAADLARDFIDLGEKVVPRLMVAGGDYWRGKYEAWAKAFKLAAGTGLVYFH